MPNTPLSRLMSAFTLFKHKLLLAKLNVHGINFCRGKALINSCGLFFCLHTLSLNSSEFHTLLDKLHLNSRALFFSLDTY
jgi:hypothetical protein